MNPMRRLIRMLITYSKRTHKLNEDERYLAQSVDASDFEIRILALERCRT